MYLIKKVTFIFILSLALSCSSSGRNEIKRGEIYSSSSGLFSLKIPNDLSLGSRVSESNGSISILDDFGGLYRIDYFRLSQNFIEDSEKRKIPPLEILEYFSVGEFFNKTLLPFMPKAKIVSTKTFQNDKGIYHLMLLFLPEGSSFTINGKRSDIHRAVVSIRIRDIVFLIHTQEKANIMGGEKKLSLEEMEKDLFSSAIQLIGTLNVK